MLMAAPATSVHSHDSAQPQILQEPTRVARRRIDDTTHRAPPPPPIRRCRLRFQISCSAHCVDTCICSERAERAHDGQEVHHQHSEEELNMFTLLYSSQRDNPEHISQTPSHFTLLRTQIAEPLSAFRTPREVDFFKAAGPQWKTTTCNYRGSTRAAADHRKDAAGRKWTGEFTPHGTRTDIPMLRAAPATF
jgi:hypothetical protein